MTRKGGWVGGGEGTLKHRTGKSVKSNESRYYYVMSYALCSHSFPFLLYVAVGISFFTLCFFPFLNAPSTEDFVGRNSLPRHDSCVRNLDSPNWFRFLLLFLFFVWHSAGVFGGIKASFRKPFFFPLPLLSSGSLYLSLFLIVLFLIPDSRFEIKIVKRGSLYTLDT